MRSFFFSKRVVTMPVASRRASLRVARVAALFD
jgi:hypothetical protein